MIQFVLLDVKVLPELFFSTMSFTMFTKTTILVESQTSVVIDSQSMNLSGT